MIFIGGISQGDVYKRQVYERKLQLMSREKTGRPFQRGKKQGARLDEHGGNAYT